jgi:hypothetical protein
LRVGSRRLEWVVVTLLVVTIGAAGTKSLLAYGAVLGEQLHMTTSVPRLGAPPNAAVVTSPFSNGYRLMKTLFWNPNATRVLAMGSTAGPDGFPATAVRLAPGKGFLDSRGRPVPGPFAFDTDTLAATTTTQVGTPAPATLRRAPELIAFGWNRLDHYLETVTALYAVASTKPLAVDIGLANPGRPKTIGFVCGNAKKAFVIGNRSRVQVQFRVPAHTVLRCRIALIRGEPVSYQHRLVSVRAFLQGLRTGGGTSHSQLGLYAIRASPSSKRKGNRAKPCCSLGAEISASRSRSTDRQSS